MAGENLCLFVHGVSLRAVSLKAVLALAILGWGFCVTDRGASADLREGEVWASGYGYHVYDDPGDCGGENPPPGCGGELVVGGMASADFEYISLERDSPDCVWPCRNRVSVVLTMKRPSSPGKHIFVGLTSDQKIAETWGETHGATEDWAWRPFCYLRGLSGEGEEGILYDTIHPIKTDPDSHAPTNPKTESIQFGAHIAYHSACLLEGNCGDAGGLPEFQDKRRAFWTCWLRWPAYDDGKFPIAFGRFSHDNADTNPNKESLDAFEPVVEIRSGLDSLYPYANDVHVHIHNSRRFLVTNTRPPTKPLARRSEFVTQDCVLTAWRPACELEVWKSDWGSLIEPWAAQGEREEGRARVFNMTGSGMSWDVCTGDVPSTPCDVCVDCPGPAFKFNNLGAFLGYRWVWTKEAPLRWTLDLSTLQDQADIRLWEDSAEAAVQLWNSAVSSPDPLESQPSSGGDITLYPRDSGDMPAALSFLWFVSGGRLLGVSVTKFVPCAPVCGDVFFPAISSSVYLFNDHSWAGPSCQQGCANATEVTAHELGHSMSLNHTHGPDIMTQGENLNCPSVTAESTEPLECLKGNWGPRHWINCAISPIRSPLMMP